MKSLRGESPEKKIGSLSFPGSSSYNSFAYHVALLKEFVRENDPGGKGSQSNRSHRKLRRNNSLRGSFRSGGGLLNFNERAVAMDGSVHSAGSLRGFRTNNSNPSSKGGPVNTSVPGSGAGGVYQEWKSKGLMNPRKGK